MGPTTRPTEWVTAVVGIATALLLWSSDHNTAALITAIGSFVPALITAIVNATGYPRNATS